jgi:hypothetical protein
VSTTTVHLALVPFSIPYLTESPNSIIAGALLRLHYLNVQIHSLNPTLHGVSAVIWTEIQLQYSIVACVSHCLKPFMSAVSTQYGSAVINIEIYDTVNGPGTKGYGVGSQRSNNNSYALGSKKRGVQSSALESVTRGEDEGKTVSLFRPDTSFNRTIISHEPRTRCDTDSKGSNESTRMIIRKEREYTVQIEDHHQAAGRDEIGSS